MDYKFLADSTANTDIENTVIRFFDTEYNVVKMQDACYATVNNHPVALKDAILLYNKKLLIKQYKSLPNNNCKHFLFRKLLETPVENLQTDNEVMNYLTQLHRTCPDNQYLCLLFFNTVSIDPTAYAYEDCSDLFKAYADSQIQVYTLCYLKKKLTPVTLATIIHNANILGLNTHISISSFRRPRRITENLYCVSSIIIDLDYYKTEYSEIDNYDDFREALQPVLGELGIEPSAIVYSGHGYYLTFNLSNNVNLKYPSIHWLYHSVVQKLIEKFERFGADFACCDLTRVFKIPGSINFKTGNQVTLCSYNPSHTINLSKLADNLGVHTRAENKIRENASAYQKYYYGNKSRFTNVNHQRMEDFEYLLKLRDYKLPHIRNLYFLFVSINCFNMGWSTSAVLTYCKELNGKLLHPLTEKELERLIMYLSNQLNEDGTCKLKYKNDHIVRTLGITDAEQKFMHQLISCKTRKSRKEAWDKANAKYKTLETKHRNDELFNELMYLRHSELMTNSEISKELNLDVRTVTSRIGATPASVQLQKNLFKKSFQQYTEESICFEIHMLQKEHYTLKQISTLLNMSIRTVQRYVHIIKQYHTYQKCR